MSSLSSAQSDITHYILTSQLLPIRMASLDPKMGQIRYFFRSDFSPIWTQSDTTELLLTKYNIHLVQFKYTTEVGLLRVFPFYK